jgi:hypothetical protein
MNPKEKAKIEHEKWLIKNNCHISQIKKRKPAKKRMVGFNVASEYYANLANTVAPPVLNNSIWEQIRQGNESPETIQAIKEKASNCMPLSNKAGIQYTTDKKEIENAGRKTAI